MFSSLWRPNFIPSVEVSTVVCSCFQSWQVLFSVKSETMFTACQHGEWFTQNVRSLCSECMTPCIGNYVRGYFGGPCPRNLKMTVLYYTHPGTLNTLSHYADFKRPWQCSFLKTLCVKEKILVTSVFSFSHNVFYSSQSKYQFNKPQISYIVQIEDIYRLVASIISFVHSLFEKLFFYVLWNLNPFPNDKF